MPDSAPSMPSSSGTTSPDSSPSSSALGRCDAALRAYGNFVFRYRDYLAPAVVLLVVALTHPRPWRGDARDDALLDAIGVLVSLTGQTLRILVIGLAYIQRGGKNKRIAADALVTDGLFAHCRHPLYVGNFLLLSGLLIVWNSVPAYVVGLVVVGGSLYAMAYAEEAFLSRRFGAQYDAYCRRV